MAEAPSSQTRPGQPRVRRREKQPRKCAQCGQVFSKAEHLDRHIRSHTKERPFGCELCRKSYSRYDSLLRHARTHQSSGGLPPTQEVISILSPQPSQFGDSLTPSGMSQNAPLPNESSPAQDGSCASAVATADAGATSSTRNVYSTPSGNAVYAVFNGQQEPVVEVDRHCAPAPAGVRHFDQGLLAASTLPVEHVANAFGGMPDNLVNTPTDFGFLDPGVDNYEPGWLLGGDFDVDALNCSISATLSYWGQQGAAHTLEQRRLYEAASALNGLHAPSPAPEVTTRVSQTWYTRMPQAVSPPDSTIQLPDQELVDEIYREGLSHRLQPRMSHPALPSADFLNLCIKLYFIKFNPIFPVIHAPTFRPCSENALLLLSICSVGALFVGSTSATAQGRIIFQILNKAILASWENYIQREGREALSLTQAALIGQTFGMLSGQPQDLCMTESFHGTVIAWARQAGLFKIRDSAAALGDDLDNVTDVAWRSWAEAEESVRLVLGLHVHDTEFATSFHHEPLLRHTLRKLPTCSSDEIFTATSATQWRSMARLRRDARPPASSFVHNVDDLELSTPKSQIFLYASLSGILSSIQEAKESIIDAAAVQRFRDRLLAWYNDHHKMVEGSRPHPIALMVLWHMAFMCLYADFDLLERVIGRDGNLQAQQASFKVRSWASSSEARRGVLHARLVLKEMEALSMGAEAAIHVPKALFYSALLVHCYTNIGSPVKSWTPSQDEINIPELQVSGHPQSSHQLNGRSWPIAFSAVDKSLLCSTIDLLRRVGHWEISQRYAAILENLLDDFSMA